jgi:hypothetical protein
MALLEDQIEEAQAAFVAAHDAGDKEGAQVLADHLRDLQSQKVAVDTAAKESSQSGTDLKNPMIAGGVGAVVGATVNPLRGAVHDVITPPVAPPKMTAPAPSSLSGQLGQGGENWTKSLTGVDVPNAQMNKGSLDTAQRMAATVGRGGPLAGGRITEGGIMLGPELGAKPPVAPPTIPRTVGQAKDAGKSLIKGFVADHQPNSPFSIVKGGTRGAITGATLADIPQQLQQGNYGTAASDLGIAAGNVAHGLARTPKGKAIGTLLGLGSGVLRGYQGINELTGEPEEQKATGGLVHLAEGGQPEFGTAQAYEPSYSEKIRDYAAQHIGREHANRLFGGANARPEDNFNPIAMAAQTPGVIADAASGFVKAGKEGDYLGGMGNYLMGAMNVAPMIKPGAQVAKTAMRELGPKAANMAEDYLSKIGGIQYAMPKGDILKGSAKNTVQLPSGIFNAAPEQTVTDPLRNAFPGIYKRPDVIASEAAARVAPESDALKRLFGVSRDDLYEMGKGRVGNISGVLPGAAANPKGSKAAIAVMNPRNEQRLLDVLSESEKHPALVKGMDPWYIMDPAYKRLEELVGPEEAVKKYRQLNTLTGMASPGSDVLTEMNRGTAANYLATQGRFGDFVDYAGLPFGARGAGFPEDLRAVMGHPYHKTAQATPMQKYLESGQVQMSSPKVPMYIDASGVPQTGFQTDMPVGDAHWSRSVGLADTRGAATRKGKSVVPGASVSNPEMSQLGPWWKDRIASQVGLESVPAQARTWGAFSPQTGVESPIGAPKLELLAMKIMEAANRLGITPEQARDMILTGKAYAGKAEGGPIDSYAPGGKVMSAAGKLLGDAKAAYKSKFTPGFYHGSGSNKIKEFDTQAERNPNFLTAFEEESNNLAPRGFVSLTNNPKFSNDYATGNKATVYPVSANLGKHFDPRLPENYDVFHQYRKHNPESFPDYYGSSSSLPKSFREAEWSVMEDPGFIQHLKDKGYNSMTMVENKQPNVGIFNPADIRGKFAKFNPEDAADPDFMKAAGGSVEGYAPGGKVLGGLAELLQLIKNQGGAGAAQRLERAADLVPNLEHQYQPQALKEAFGSGNNSGIVVMNPNSFENYAAPLSESQRLSKNGYKIGEPSAESGYANVPWVSFDEKIKSLQQHVNPQTGTGFSSVPYLQLEQQHSRILPQIYGHEGRHRSEALSQLNTPSTIVQIRPVGELKGRAMGDSNQEFLENIKKLIGNPTIVKPETFTNPNKYTETISRKPIGLPEIFKKGGKVKKK